LLLAWRQHILTPSLTRRIIAVDALQTELWWRGLAPEEGLPPKHPPPGHDLLQLAIRARGLEEWAADVLSKDDALRLPSVTAFFQLDSAADAMTPPPSPKLESTAAAEHPARSSSFQPFTVSEARAAQRPEDATERTPATGPHRPPAPHAAPPSIIHLSSLATVADFSADSDEGSTADSDDASGFVLLIAASASALLACACVALIQQSGGTDAAAVHAAVVARELALSAHASASTLTNAMAVAVADAAETVNDAVAAPGVSSITSSITSTITASARQLQAATSPAAQSAAALALRYAANALGSLGFRASEIDDAAAAAEEKAAAAAAAEAGRQRSGRSEVPRASKGKADAPAEAPPMRRRKGGRLPLRLLKTVVYRPARFAVQAVTWPIRTTLAVYTWPIRAPVQALRHMATQGA
jgi:hypothetical protein